MNIMDAIQNNPNVILQISGTDLLEFAKELANDVREQAIKDTHNFMAERLLSGKEAAKLCGVQYTTFWRWVKNGKIPQMKGAGNPRYRLSDIQKMMTDKK